MTLLSSIDWSAEDKDCSTDGFAPSSDSLASVTCLFNAADNCCFNASKEINFSINGLSSDTDFADLSLDCSSASIGSAGFCVESTCVVDMFRLFLGTDALATEAKSWYAGAIGTFPRCCGSDRLSMLVVWTVQN